MVLEKLLSQIAADTEREVAAILAEAEAKAAVAEADTRARFDRLWQRESEVLRRRLQFAALQKCSAREVESRRRLLQEREALLDELRQRLAQWLSNLPPEEEKNLLRSLLQRGLKYVRRGTLIANARSRQLLGEAPADFRWQEEHIAGLRLVSEDVRIVIDLTYPTLLGEFWQRYRSQVAGHLLAEARLLQDPPT